MTCPIVSGGRRAVDTNHDLAPEPGGDLLRAATSTTSAKVYEPALQGLSFMAGHSRVLRHHAAKGWKPCLFFHAGAAPSFE
jgi:hypothetical protein